VSNSRARFSGFGDAVTNHKLWLQSQRIAKQEREKKEEIPTSFKDPRFVSISEQIRRNNQTSSIKHHE